MKSRKRKNKKNRGLFVVVLSILVVGIGFAALQKYLTINGTASINSNFDVRFMHIDTKEIVGGAYNNSEPTYTDTTATFDAMFLTPGDSITYDITINNVGTMNALLENIDVNIENNENISYELTGIQNGDILESRPPAVDGGIGDGPGMRNSKIATLKLTYTGLASEKVSSNIKITMKFVQTNTQTDTQTSAISLIENEKPTVSYTLGGVSNEVIEINGNSGRKVEVYMDWNTSHEEELSEYFAGVEVSRVYYNDQKIAKNPGDFAFVAVLDVQDIIKIRNVYSINGKNYYSAYSDETPVRFVSNEGFVYEQNNATNILATDDTYFTDGIMTLQAGRRLTKMTSKNITKVVIPENYNLADLGENSLPHPQGYGTSLNTIVNKTGESINWAPILGYYYFESNGGAKTCEFVTGTCAGVNIVAE